ncbi:MAG: hypothetical protein ABFD77_02475 [Thermotogota bacterium]
MTSPRAKLAALRALADHPETPKEEADNARRRIAEIEAKYKAGSGAPGRNPFEVWGADEWGVDMSEDGVFTINVGIPFSDEDFLRHVANAVNERMRQAAERARARGPAQRVHRVDNFDDFVNIYGNPGFRPGGGNSDYGWFFDSWLEWCRGRKEGPFKRVSIFSFQSDKDPDVVVISWKCPGCGRKVEHRTLRTVMTYATSEPAARYRITSEIFTRLNGDSDNRCGQCCRHNAVSEECSGDDPWPRFSGRTLREFGGYVIACWIRQPSPTIGPFGKVGHVGLCEPLDDFLTFQWWCPSCAHGFDFSKPHQLDEEMLRHKFHWKEIQEIIRRHGGVKEFMEGIFRFWDGHEDNRCERCREKEGAKCASNS